MLYRCREKLHMWSILERQLLLMYKIGDVKLFTWERQTVCVEVMNKHRKSSAYLRLIHTYHAFPLPCRSAKGLDYFFPIWFTQYGRVWFTYAMSFPCHSPAIPRPYRSESDLSRPRLSAAWERHGMCELASAVQRRHVGDLPAFGFFRLPRGVPRSLLP
jgi:hypothetical protein